MAVIYKSRFKPDTHRSTLEATIMGLNTEQGTGTVVMPVQIVAYDDAAAGVTWADYVPGDPAFEKFITVLYEDTLQAELLAFATMTSPQATTYWQNALDAWALGIKPVAPSIVRAVRSAKRMAPRDIP